MPMYEYECHNPKCPRKAQCGNPHEFEAIVSIKDMDKMPKCPLCQSSSSKHIKKVIRSAFPVSHTWS